MIPDQFYLFPFLSMVLLGQEYFFTYMVYCKVRTQNVEDPQIRKFVNLVGLVRFADIGHRSL